MVRRRQRIRQERREERGPRRFDPDQRGRDFPNKRKRRGRGQESHQTVERRVSTLETWSYLSTHVAIQPPANSFIQVVTELPEPSYLDIGRQLIVRSTAAVPDVLYVGMQQSEGVVAWVQWTSSYEGGGGVPIDNTSVAVSFVKHIPLGVKPLGCHATTDYVYFSSEGSNNLKRYARTGGAIVDIGWPGVLQPHGIYAQDDGKLWVAVAATATTGSVRYWNGTTTTTSPDTDIGYRVVAYNPVNDTINAGGVRSSGGGLRQMNKTTLVSPGLSILTGGVWGVAVDSDGFVYVSTSGDIFKLNSSFGYLDQFDGTGSVFGSLGYSRGLAIDGVDRLFVADEISDRVQIFEPDGGSVGVFGVGGTGAGQFNEPLDVTIHGDSLWVADSLNNRLSQWTIDP